MEELCSSCHKPLIRVKWNSTTDILICDNPYCSKFRNPITPPETTTDRKKYDSPFKEKMQRLRGIIYSEE